MARQAQWPALCRSLPLLLFDCHSVSDFTPLQVCASVLYQLSALQHLSASTQCSIIILYSIISSLMNSVQHQLTASQLSALHQFSCATNYTLQGTWERGLAALCEEATKLAEQLHTVQHKNASLGPIQQASDATSDSAHGDKAAAGPAEYPLAVDANSWLSDDQPKADVAQHLGDAPFAVQRACSNLDIAGSVHGLETAAASTGCPLAADATRYPGC